jgi:hypothetical protein
MRISAGRRSDHAQRLRLVGGGAHTPAAMRACANRVPGRRCRADVGVLCGSEHFLALGSRRHRARIVRMIIGLPGS